MSSVSDVPRIVNELITLIITYLKEQTTIPLKRIIRYVGFGVIGSFFFACGVVLLSLGILRFLQTLTTFNGTFSFVPYLLVLIANCAGIGIFFKVMTQSSLIAPRIDTSSASQSPRKRRK